MTNKLIQEHVNSKVSVSEKEMREYFDKSDEFHKKEQVRALHIMVESEEEIREIQKEIRRKQKGSMEVTWVILRQVRCRKSLTMFLN